jgi:hypothetical protein
VAGEGGGGTRGGDILDTLTGLWRDDLVLPDTIDDAADDTSTIVSSSEATSWPGLLDGGVVVVVMISGCRAWFAVSEEAC